MRIYNLPFVCNEGGLCFLVCNEGEGRSKALLYSKRRQHATFLRLLASNDSVFEQYRHS